MKKFLICLSFVVLITGITNKYSPGEEIPRPTYDNSVMFSITHNYLLEETAEIEKIKGQFGNGMYAPLFFSGFEGIDMDWNIDLSKAGGGIKEFRDKFDQMIAFSKRHKTGIHLTLNYGLARFVDFYKEAKEEDLRNAQWYNDNNLSSAAQVGGPGGGAIFPLDLNHIDGSASGQFPAPVSAAADSDAADSVINKYVFATLSRYARKLRAHVNAKVAAVFAYIFRVQAANPGVSIVISAPGEVELSYSRINQTQFLQDYFCDYSPFAVLEFRDWIRHGGLYADDREYAGGGYINGGSRYGGPGGLANFNVDFGTSFSTWDLKYFNWGLGDPVDADYTDGVNPDPNIIPVSRYTYDGMMPTSGAHYIAGGFDPPRVMHKPGTNAFYDLWQTFRETMVHHYVKDMANIALAEGFPKDHYYTHQIPADYLFGTRPNDALIPYLNPRYYSSASPLWTALAYPGTGVGITLYDINFGTWFARTTLYGIEAVQALSGNWAALEYNPEVIPAGFNVALSGTRFLYDQMMRLYNGRPHFISFFKWVGPADYQFKGTNRGAAAKQFFDAVKDKARQPIDTMFTPRAVEAFIASFNSVSGLVNLNWSEKIWPGLKYNWTDWGDFKEFVIYRGNTPDFTPSAGSEIARKTGFNYSDNHYEGGQTVYYKIAAVNAGGVAGPTRMVSVLVPGGTSNAILDVDRGRLNFGHITSGENPAFQYFHVLNQGTGVLNWTVTDDSPWLVCTPSAGIDGSQVEVFVNSSDLAAGTYNGTVTISSPNAANSPRTVSIYLVIKNAVNDRPPFGEFSTPFDGAVVSGSIPVTGWALDDIGISGIKIYRDPIAGEGPEMVYIGDALRVENARPDIENAYNDYPFNYKAGWGYMLLSNFLPNAGNGTFKLYAVVEDTKGSRVTLGGSVITCDNTNAGKPFGAIDTPAPGGIISGPGYRCLGWALTPIPNTIPIDGSTITVYIDGVAVGHVTYNIPREDIAALFTGYSNSRGAGGYFDFDTTRYADGIHTIAWVVSDNAGNSEGIGSRYFTIRNEVETGQNKNSPRVFPGKKIITGSLNRENNQWK